MSVTGPNQDGLGALASRGAAFTMLAQLLRIAIQLLSLVILARLLSPGDYGLIAMVVAIVGVGEIVRDFGLSFAAIQAKKISDAQRSNLFWLNTWIGGGLAVVTVLVSPLIAAFYGEPRLQLLAAALSGTFLLNGMSTQYRAALTRDLKMVRLSIVEVSSQAIALIVGIVMAIQGAGYWSLAGQQLTQPLASLFLLLAFTRWIPGLYTRRSGMRSLIGFGSSVFFSQLLTYASRNVDSIIIGSQFGATALGVYSRAFQLLLLPLNQISAPSTRVALPVLAKLQDSKQRYADFIITGQTVILHATLAVFSVACALAAPLVLLVLGSNWDGVSQIFQILTIAGVFQVAGYANYWVYLSKGLSKQLVWWSLATKPLLIVALLVGSHWGMLGVAWAYSIGTAVLWPVGLFWISRISDAPAMRMFTNGIRSIVAYALCGLAAFLVLEFVSETSDLLGMALAVGAWALALGILAAIWPALRRDFATIIRAGKLLKR